MTLHLVKLCVGAESIADHEACIREKLAAQKARGRQEWIQLGWLYVDTIEILRKLSGGEHHFLTDVLNLDALETLLRERGNKVAGIVTEVPTNPLLQTPDLDRLREITYRYQIPLVADPTLASPYNIDLLPHCDVAVNSLTKYAGNQGDVMQGAVVVNPASPWAPVLRETVPNRTIPPYAADLSRMAVEIRDYRSVVGTINANTMVLTDWLQRHPRVAKVFGAYSAESGQHYTRLQRRPHSPGGVVSIQLRGPVADFYDRVEIPKGPSFGTVFTLLCPFLYLAHYNLVSTEEGRAHLRSNGLDAELLRISVGVEEPDQIIAAFQKAL
jgi:cystathionine gamma-synthase